MIRMKDHADFEQVGRLVEEYSKLKGELIHTEETLKRAQAGAQFLASYAASLMLNGDTFALSAGVRVNQGNLVDLEGLLSYSELLRVFRERIRLRSEVAEAGKRLNAVAPNVTGILY